jgi:uncharacterized phage-associated protein
MIITNQREKLLNAIIYFCHNTKYCGKTKLMKLLYFLDFIHFKQTGKSVTGLDYFAWEMGPVPRGLYEELDSMNPDLAKAITILPQDEFQKICAKQKFDDRYFTQRQMKLLKTISDIFFEAKADLMVESTHLKNHPWDKTIKSKGKFQKIDYLLAIDDDKDSLSYEEAKERKEEIEEMHKIFGLHG